MINLFGFLVTTFVISIIGNLIFLLVAIVISAENNEKGSKYVKLSLRILLFQLSIVVIGFSICSFL